MGTVICVVTGPTRNPSVEIAVVPSNPSAALRARGSIAQPETAALAPEPSSHQTSCKHSAVKCCYSTRDRERQTQIAEAGVRFLI